MYVTIEELAEKLSISVSRIRSWLNAGYFSKGAYFGVDNEYRFNLEKVIEELHSESFGEVTAVSSIFATSKVDPQNTSQTEKEFEIPSVNKILLKEYKYLVSQLLDIISRNILLPNSTSNKLRRFEDEFSNGYDFKSTTVSIHEAVSLLKDYNLEEVVDNINEFIIATYVGDQRRALLDNIGIFNDLSKIQKSMLDKYNEYISCEDEARQKMLVSVGVDYDVLDEVLSDEEVILEGLETALANHDEVIALSKEQSEMIAEMRKSLFSKIYDFEKGEFKT